MSINNFDFLKIFNKNFKHFNEHLIGFDEFIKKAVEFTENANKNSKYPPYNIKKLDDGKYSIEVAVAGFSKHDIDIDVNGDTLTITGLTSSNDDNQNFISKGIASRSFVRSFKMTDKIEVKNAKLINGMIEIIFESIVPEKKKIVIETEEKELN